MPKYDNMTPYNRYFILNLGTSRRLVVSFTLRPLYPVERDSGTHRIEGMWIPNRTPVV